MSNNVYIHFREICFHDLKYLQVFQPYGTNLIIDSFPWILNEKLYARDFELNHKYYYSTRKSINNLGYDVM